MRNLKRALSLVLAVVMVIGLMVVGASAVSYNDFSDRGEIVNKDAVSMLTTLGIIEGQPDGSYNPTGDVDRAQMAKMISVALTNNEDCDTLYQNVNSGLTDISANWARGYINYCYVRGIIAGRGDNTFDPSANVTGVEAAKMLLAALGYNAEIEGLVGPDWALNTAALAQQLGIFRNFTKDVSEPLNRDDAALLIYNALDVELIQEYRNGYAISYDDHRTILSSVFGVMRVEGVVVGNEWAQLEQTDSEAALREGRTTLENVIVYDSTTANTVVDEGVRYDGVVPFNVTTPVDYMGKAVTLYVEKTTVLSNSKVIGVATKDDMNVILTTASTEDTSKDYLKGTGVTVDEDTEYYVNYGYCANELTARDVINEHANWDLNLNNDYFVANGIPVEIIDNNDDGKAEYVLYTMETLSEVRSYSERNEELSLYDYARDDSGDLKNNVKSFTVEFADVVYPNDDTVATDDLVLYVQYGGRTYITLPEIITGTMSRVDRDENDELYITVNDTEYRQSYIPDAASRMDPEMTHFDITEARDVPGFDTEYDFILDSNGYVVAVRPAEETTTNYGLVINSAWTQNALTRGGEIEILKADGTTSTYDINWNESRKVFSYVGTSNARRDTELETYLGTRDVMGGTPSTGSAVGSVIIYTLNDDETVLTIKDILGLHDLDADGYVSVPANNTDKNICNGDISDTAGNGVAYIDANPTSLNGVADDKDNLQWLLAADYDKGDASIDLTTKAGVKGVEYAVDRNTVAFYFVRNADGTITYSVATGWNNMGDVDIQDKDGYDLDIAVQVYPVEQKQNDRTWQPTKLAEVVLFNAETTITSRDYMLVLSRNAYTASDELWLNVVFEDGTAKEIQIDDAGDFDAEDPTAYMAAYAYVENADGTYDIVEDTMIDDHDAELLLNGTVQSDHIYALPDDADVWDVTDMSTAKDEVREGHFSYIEVHSVIIPTTVNGRTIRTAFVWEMDSTSTPDVDDPGDLYVRYDDSIVRVYNPKNASRLEIARAITNELRDAGFSGVTVGTLDLTDDDMGNATATDEDSGLRLTIAIKQAYRVTYNGEYVGMVIGGGSIDIRTSNRNTALSGFLVNDVNGFAGTTYDDVKNSSTSGYVTFTAPTDTDVTNGTDKAHSLAANTTNKTFAIRDAFAIDSSITNITFTTVADDVVAGGQDDNGYLWQTGTVMDVDVANGHALDPNCNLAKRVVDGKVVMNAPVTAADVTLDTAYTVTYSIDKAYGLDSDAPDDSTVVAGENFRISPKKEIGAQTGYVFIGWKLGSKLYAPGDTIAKEDITANESSGTVTLTAVFVEKNIAKHDSFGTSNDVERNAELTRFNINEELTTFSNAVITFTIDGTEYTVTSDTAKYYTGQVYFVDWAGTSKDTSMSSWTTGDTIDMTVTVSYEDGGSMTIKFPTYTET